MHFLCEIYRQSRSKKKKKKRRILWFNDSCAQWLGDRLKFVFSPDIILCDLVGSKQLSRVLLYVDYFMMACRLFPCHPECVCEWPWNCASFHEHLIFIRNLAVKLYVSCFPVLHVWNHCEIQTFTLFRNKRFFAKISFC